VRGEPVSGPSKSIGLKRDPSPTALRSPLSPGRGIKIIALSVGERGDRKAVGEGSTRGGCIPSSGDMRHRIMDRSEGLVGRLLHDVEKGRMRRTPQPTEGSSYYSSTHREDFRLDWTKEAEELQRWIRTSPGQCFADVAGQQVFFLDAQVVAARSEAAPGVLIRVDETSCTVATGKDALRARRVRVDPVGAHSAPELLRALGLGPGQSLS
jgi:hypothetical protein